MFPIKDHNPSHSTPYVTYAIIAVCSIVWLYEVFLGSQLGVFFETWALHPAEIVAGHSMITLVTSMFLHGGWMHIIGNMLFLYIFGDNLEARMGRFKFILFYLLSGFAASGLQILTDPSSMVPNIGASGAIAGVMGAYLSLYPKAKVDTIIIGRGIQHVTLPAYYMLGYWFAIQLFSGVGSLASSVGGGGVAYWAHIGGFVAGRLMMIPYKRGEKVLKQENQYK